MKPALLTIIYKERPFLGSLLAFATSGSVLILISKFYTYLDSSDTGVSFLAHGFCSGLLVESCKQELVLLHYLFNC